MITIGALLAFSACNDDFLDSEPIVDQTAEGYFQTPKNALEGLTGCYNGLVLDEWTNAHMIPTIASDEAFAGGGQGEATSDVPYGWDEFEEAGNRNQNAAIWANRYTAIYRCNSFLENLEGVNWGEDDNLAIQYEAEARFLRAYYYFDLVRFFENVPLVTSAEVNNTKQADPADVFEQIAEDLKFAAENLEGIPYSDMSSNDYGHATRWAAESMMGRVFLYYTGRYNQEDLAGVVSESEVIDYLEDVIQNSGHDLVDDFENLWPVSSVSGEGEYVGEDNVETVFAIKYSWGPSAEGRGNNRWLINYGLRWHDGTPAPYSWGWGQGTVSEKYWSDVYDDGDTRKSASILSVEEELNNQVANIDDDGNVTYNEFDHTQWADYTGYFNKKYIPLVTSMDDFTELPISKDPNNNAQYDQFQDWVVIRYADVLLMAAELQLGTAKADEYVQQVRARAFDDPDMEVSGVTMEEIREERQREFFFEGIRYWDLMRYGQDIASQEINTTEVVLEGGEEKTKDIVFDTSKEGFFQIPWDQIDLSYEDGEYYLEQNPGWE
ncbi:MAG: RagB/SusD family nutrient uptake outer membrane protein [Marinilabilia sp.]